MTGRVFSKLFFSFVVVLFLGMVVLDFSLRQVMEQSLRAQAEESLVGEARLLAAHLSASGPASLGCPVFAENCPHGCHRYRGGSSHLQRPGPGGCLLPRRSGIRTIRSPRSPLSLINISPWAAPSAGARCTLPFPPARWWCVWPTPLSAFPQPVHVLRRGIVRGLSALADGGDAAGGMAGAAGRQAPGPHRGLRQPHRRRRPFGASGRGQSG